MQCSERKMASGERMKHLCLAAGSAVDSTDCAPRNRSAIGSASFRRADAAQICNNVGFVLEGDGPTEGSVATAARQIVRVRW